MISGVALTAWAQVAETVEAVQGIETWPVTSLMALITLSSLAGMCFCMKNVFTTMQRYTESSAKATEAVLQLCSRLDQRPCIKEDR